MAQEDQEELGRPREGLAEKAGIHRTSLSDVVRGTRNLTLVNIERLAAARAHERDRTVRGGGASGERVPRDVSG